MTIINGNKVVVISTAEELARTAAMRFVSAAQDAVRTRDRFTTALSGGETPRRVYEILGTQFAMVLDWSRIHIFFGDERCVPPDNPASNYLMAYNALISKVAIPPFNVHRMIGEEDPAAGAAAYEQELRRVFRNSPLPRLDLMFLGLGRDGHTASLFPRSSVLNETTTWVGTSTPAGNVPDRITLTLPVINNAAQVLFLVSGADKAEVLSHVLRSTSGPVPPMPAQLIKPTNGTLEWLVDRAAAALLK